MGIGIFLSILYILYALCCLPAQGFNVVSSVGRMAEILTGKTIAVDSVFYYVAGAAIIVLTSVIAFGGIKKVSKWTDMMVPVMAVLYILVVFILILLNVGRFRISSELYLAELLSRRHFLEVQWEQFLPRV